jgi:hypothetical protein
MDCVSFRIMQKTRRNLFTAPTHSLKFGVIDKASVRVRDIAHGRTSVCSESANAVLLIRLNLNIASSVPVVAGIDRLETERSERQLS